jgi:hypothetical protein
LPIVNSGFSAVSGSWKIIDSALPRLSSISRSESATRSTPSRTTFPPTIFPGGSGTSRMIDSAVMDFPQPDSPTMPSVSFSRTSNEMSSTPAARPPG